MTKSKWAPLDGKNNSRIQRTDVKNQSTTFPLADKDEICKSCHLTKPSEEDVIHAKEWVDDGSLL